MAQNRQMSLFRETETENYRETDGQTTSFEIERDCFKHLKENLSSEAKTEYETGVKHLVERYNTAIYENRFTVETSNGIGRLQYESQRRCCPTTHERT